MDQSTVPASRVRPRVVYLTVLVAALGYFVDLYDLILFSIVRVQSLTAIGVDQAHMLSTGAMLLQMQMFGMLLGGIAWGVLGDKRGRLSVLFGSIIMYSLANLLNAFVTTVPQYAVLRLLAGIGLAGELGAGITLVAEIMPRESRGYATTMVAALGICGGLVAVFVGEVFDWRVAFIVGGVMGIALLLLRIGVHESGLFQQIKTGSAARGRFSQMFANRRRLVHYLGIILVGVPIWYVVGILITFSPEFGRAVGMPTPPSAGRAVMFSYMGLAIGDFVSGWLSQKVRSRKRVLRWFLTFTSVCVAVYYIPGPRPLPVFYGLCFALGLGAGYWAVFVTVASEQFGTNLRATATTTVPNFVRGAVVPLTSAFQALTPHVGIAASGLSVGIVTLVVAFLCVRVLEETYGRDLDFVEH